MKPFGTLLKDARIASGRTLRDASKGLPCDVELLSKIERLIDPAPSDQATLARWAAWLGLQNDALYDFFNAAAASVAAGPGPLPTEADVDEHMPLFLRGLNVENIALLRVKIRETLTPTACLRGSR